MVTWEIYDNHSGKEWDEILLSAEDYNVFQSHEWGEYKRHAGWEPLRYLARNKGGFVVCMVQFSVKRLPLGLAIAWAAGGPVIQFKNAGSLNASQLFEGLFEDVRKKYSKVLIRFHSHLEHNALINFNFSHVLKRPIFKINSGYSTKICLANSEGDAIPIEMSKKHRYYVKKAKNENIVWRVGNDDDDIRALQKNHDEMIESKNIKEIATNLNELTHLRDCFQKNITILTGYVDDEPVTSCLALNFGAKSFYMTAATSAKGRELSAAYAMVDKLFDVLRSDGIVAFDFAGVDPVNPSAAGVNHFKRGFGGGLFEHVGEWEYSSSVHVRYIINFAIYLRGGRA